MGKETCYEMHLQRCVKLDKPIQSPSFLTRTQLDKELSDNWASINGTVLQTEVKENGKIVVIVRSRGEERYLVCSGFANTGNKCAKLVEKLRETKVVSKLACIKHFLALKEYMWCSVEVATSFFDSGDSFLIIIGNRGRTTERKSKRARECREKVLVPRHKSIKKHN